MDRMQFLKQRLQVNNETGCWEWTKGCNRCGYGRTHVSEDGVIKGWSVHRLMWRLLNGPIPAGAYICHHCDNKKCANPDHLYLGNAQTNIQDAVRRGRMASGDRNGSRKHPESRPCGDRNTSRSRPECLPRGEDNGSSKLTESEVREMRQLHASGKMGYRRLAVRFRVSRQVVGLIVQRRSWAHVV